MTTPDFVSVLADRFFVFRHKVLALLRDLDLISEERIDLLLSWRHSGFNIHNHTTVYPNDTEGLHRLACYLHRAPVNSCCFLY